MSFDYFAALNQVRDGDARSKRGRGDISRKFIEALKREHRYLPMFDTDRAINQEFSCLQDDRTSNELWISHAQNNFSQRLVAKCVNGNGNCLFNATSVALIGKQIEELPGRTIRFHFFH